MGQFKKGDAVDTSRLKRVKFSLKEISDSTYIVLRALTSPEVDEHFATGADGKEKKVNGYKVVSLSAIDEETGQPLFVDEEDARQSLNISAESLVNMMDKVLEISGLGDKDRSKN